MKGQDAGATDKERALAQERLSELVTVVNKCLIRRTSALLSKYLPLKYELVVCIKMTPLQTQLYKNFIKSDSIKRSMQGTLKNFSFTHHYSGLYLYKRIYSILYFLVTDGSGKKGSLSALSAITLLKKLCNHPDLVYEKIRENSEGFEGAEKLLPANYSTK